MTTVTDLQEQQKLIFRRGDYNILGCGIRTGKTYWAINNLAQFTRDGNLNRILFLTDTTALKDQAEDRCHRIGTKSNITIYTIMCKNTIDERIHEIVEKKGVMSDALIDGKIIGNKMELINFLLS